MVYDQRGAWVSEQYLALAIVFPYFYSQIEHMSEEEEYTLPVDDDGNNKPTERWKKEECKEWMKAHGVVGRADLKI